MPILPQSVHTKIDIQTRKRQQRTDTKGPFCEIHRNLRSCWSPFHLAGSFGIGGFASLTILVSYSLNYVMQEQRLIICSSHPGIIGARGRRIANMMRRESEAVCSAAAAAGSTGHDGLGNDSLPSPHNQSPILIYVCPRPYRPARRTDFSLRCRYLLLTASPLYSR